MKSVVIPPLDDRSLSASTHGITMNYWCKDQGLIGGQDFDWSYHPVDLTVTFNFYGEAESFATMFALKWIPA